MFEEYRTNERIRITIQTTCKSSRHKLRWKEKLSTFPLSIIYSYVTGIQEVLLEILHNLRRHSLHSGPETASVYQHYQFSIA